MKSMIQVIRIIIIFLSLLLLFSWLLLSGACKEGVMEIGVRVVGAVGVEVVDRSSVVHQRCFAAPNEKLK